MKIEHRYFGQWPETKAVLACHKCGAVYLLDKAVGYSDRARQKQRQKAMEAGWTVPADGYTVCPTCLPGQVVAPPQGVLSRLRRWFGLQVKIVNDDYRDNWLDRQW